MKLFSMLLKPAFLAVLLISFTGCEKEELEIKSLDAKAVINAPGGVKAPTVEAAGNNLSFPVIWAENVAKTLREAPANAVDGILLEGEWWYVWGPEPIDPQSIIYSCAPNPSNELLCLDQTEPGTEEGLYKGWVQKDASNYWEAYNADADGVDVNVDFIDWGDNLESIDWTIQSQVRTELVLYENVVDQGETVPVLHYPMRHVDGWGITEVHGLQTDLDGVIQFGNAPGDQATVYSTHTRMTIQKLNVDRDDPSIDELVWDAASAQWTGEGIINEPILSNALYEAADGPGYFNAEVNVKGKIMYGYTWNLKKLNEGTGSYRITYSFDAEAPGSAGLNTFFTEATQIIVAEEEEEVTTAGEGESGGEGILDAAQNLTYMDINIVGKTTGGGGGNSGGGNGGGGNNSGGGGNSGGGNSGGGNGGGGNSGGGGGPK